MGKSVNGYGQQQKKWGIVATGTKAPDFQWCVECFFFYCGYTFVLSFSFFFFFLFLIALSFFLFLF